jgi:hypothetical protein
MNAIPSWVIHRDVDRLLILGDQRRGRWQPGHSHQGRTVTLRTRELPAFFGGVSATIKVASDAAFRGLILQQRKESLFRRVVQF